MAMMSVRRSGGLPPGQGIASTVGQQLRNGPAPHKHHDMVLVSGSGAHFINTDFRGLRWYQTWPTQGLGHEELVGRHFRAEAIGSPCKVQTYVPLVNSSKLR